ncbi:hypothetical protein LCGC14_1770320 [marine sediment metagenome]|uniref:Uncharacterized protein n=1 Tax=marine sediment metagenome TaxID=412755 RepID=A0A0F9GYJ0_9ZZZZ
MKVTYGPIVSDARGRFGGVVASAWKGISIFRRFQAPSNPNTAAQVLVRRTFRNLNSSYVMQSALVRDSWVTFATGRPYTGRNQYIGRNVPLLMDEADANNLLATPGDASTLPPVTMALSVAVAGEVTATLTMPTVPTGWTLAGGVLAVTRDLGYASEIGNLAALQWFEDEDIADPYDPTVTGLTAALIYQCRGFIRWTAPDGSTRYSAALAGQATIT